jgi:hypothetical protein
MEAPEFKLKVDLSVPAAGQVAPIEHAEATVATDANALVIDRQEAGDLSATPVGRPPQPPQAMVYTTGLNQLPQVEVQLLEDLKAEPMSIAGLVRRLAMGGLGLLCLTVWLIDFSDSGRMPWQTLGHYYEAFLGEPNVPTPVARKKSKNSDSKPIEIAIAPEDRVPLPQNPVMFQNPYVNPDWRVDKKPELRDKKMSAGEERDLLKRLEDMDKDKKGFQKIVEIENLMKKREDGSEDALTQLLEDPKLWVRFNAGLALADLGYLVRNADLKRIVGDDPDDRIARFVARLANKDRCSEQCLNLLGGLLAHVGPRARHAIIDAFEYRQLESVADAMVRASFDKEDGIRAKAIAWLLRNPVTDERWWKNYKMAFLNNEQKETQSQLTPTVH